MTDEEKKAYAQQFLERYRDQAQRVDWQEKKIDGLKSIIESNDNSDREEIKQAINWQAEQAKLTAEQVKLCALYREITATLDSIPDDQREILYSVYIELETQAEVATRLLVHPKTIARKHRRGLVALYEVIK